MAKEALVLDSYSSAGQRLVTRYGVNPDLVLENAEELLQNGLAEYVLISGKCYVRSFHTGLEGGK